MGTTFDIALGRVRAALPSGASLSVQLGQSHDIRERFDRGEVDLAIIRREGGSGDGEVLGKDALAWRAGENWRAAENVLPLAMLPPPCGVRAVALKALERAGLSWREAFVGGSCLAVTTAVRAGLGIAPLGGMVGGDLRDVGAELGLPTLPPSHIVLLARTGAPHLAVAARALAASIRDGLR